MKHKTAFLLAFFAIAAVSAAAANGFTIPYTLSSEPADLHGAAMLTIRSTPANADISIDDRRVGSSGWTGTLRAGSHIIAAAAPDHYPVKFMTELRENMKYSLNIRLEPHTGFLYADIEPPDAEVLVDGIRKSGGILELPVGQHSLLVRKFGYTEKQSRVTIYRNKTTTVFVGLSPASFEITRFRARPASFNPENMGLFDRITVDFSVTAPGYGSLDIRDSSGNDIWHIELPPFDTWSQSVRWDGRKSGGARVPDGEYDIVLSIWPRRTGENSGAPDGTEPAPIGFATRVKIDSTIKIVPTGYSAARPGLMFCADPKVADMPPAGIDLGLVVADGFGASVSAGFRIGSSFILGFEGLYDPSGAGGFSAGILANLLKGKGFDAAVLFRIAWTDTPDPRFPSAESGIELSIPAALRAGNLRACLSPGFIFGFAGGQAAFRMGAGIWYESPSLTGGVSLQADAGAGGFMTPQNPLRAATEAKMLFDDAPVTVFFKACGTFAPSLEKPALSAGLGFAF